MKRDTETKPAARAEALAREFFARVWSEAHDIDAIDELMTEDYVIHSAGTTIEGRAAFKAWIAEFHRKMPGAVNDVQDVFANAAGDRVLARWVCSGTNQGIFGLPPDGRPIYFSGMSLWAVRDGRLAESWVERAAPKYR